MIVRRFSIWLALISCGLGTSPLLATGLPDPTGFENVEAGEFQTLQTPIGVWKTVSGVVRIDDKHAKSGRQCLQLAGGNRSVVELEVPKGSTTAGQLSFWAERWTSRAPFSFRIEKRSGNQWSEIYDGDQTVKVGRSFLSKVVVPLRDPNLDRLRFSVTSPPNTGILIDDVRISPAKPQRVTQVQCIPMTLPALVGAPASAVLKLRIDTEGTLAPISMNKLTAQLKGTTDFNDLQSVQVYYSGSQADFSSYVPYGAPLTPGDQLTFPGNQELQEGENYFWIACVVKKQANIDHRVGAACSQIEFSNGDTTKLDHPASIQRIGVAVRRGGDDGVDTFRIPGLATTNQGTLIGVYDVRRRGGGDLPGDIDVGMSRSTDGGRTWEPMKIIMDMGDDPDFRYDGIGDPSILVDRTTGTIWCSGTWSHGNRSWVGSQPGMTPEETGQWILTKSHDDGVSWSEPINITNQVKKPEWSFILQGPGKGITLSDGTLVFPAQYQDPPDPNDKQANRLPHSTLIYSRDHGQTWDVATGAFDDTTEAQVVEIADGEIMINCRYNRQSKRVVMTTRDSGQTWTEHPTSREALIEPGSCMASLIHVGRELGSHDNRTLLFSNPNSLRGRKRITIKASPDGGATWPLADQLLLDEQNGRGYSCMSMIDANTVGILYEGSQADMTFQRIPLAEIFDANQSAKPESLSFSRVFGNHMVLQANQPIRVWGLAPPGSAIFLELGDSRGNCTTDATGNWGIELAAQPANSLPQTLTARSGDQSVSLDDLLIGEVWFCAGQSNMEWPLSRSAGGQIAIQQADDRQLRLFNFRGSTGGGAIVYDQAKFDRLNPDQFCRGSWVRSSRTTAGQFSAVGFYFARRLREELDCPIGMINVSQGGTPIESWIDQSQLGADPELSKMLNGNWLDNSVLDPWCQKRARLNLRRGISGDLEMPGDRLGPFHLFRPGYMYQAAISPFLPLSIRGVLWYQGESNADSRNRIEQYQRAFPRLVNSWRQGFQHNTMPLAIVQLPALNRSNWPTFREYQRRSLNQIQNIGMAITIDTGDRTNVHPTSKRPVGERLAQWALVKCYGKSGPAMGPIYKSKFSRGNQITIEFESVGDGLRVDGDRVNQFEIAGEDRQFHRATAEIRDNQVILASEFVDQPVHARYAWRPFPEPPANLFNSAGLPASPFTTLSEF